MNGREVEIESLKIPDFEKKNVKELLGLLHQSACKLNHRIVATVVGGVISKDWPRKDIDITCSVLDLGIDSNETKLSEVRKSFAILEDIVHGATGKSERFKVVDTTQPYVNTQFNDPNILEHDGSIVVLPLPKGALIEIINNVK